MMGKYNHLKFLKKTKARVEQQCSRCGQTISITEFYYGEKIKDKFLHSLNVKKFCINCYNQFGNKLLWQKKHL